MLAIRKLAEAPPSLLGSRVFGPLPGGTELCVWNRRTRNGEEMSFLTSGPNRNFHCDSELPGQNRKTDLCGSQELLTTSFSRKRDAGTWNVLKRITLIVCTFIDFYFFYSEFLLQAFHTVFFLPIRPPIIKNRNV